MVHRSAKKNADGGHNTLAKTTLCNLGYIQVGKRVAVEKSQLRQKKDIDSRISKDSVATDSSRCSNQLRSRVEALE